MLELFSVDYLGTKMKSSVQKSSKKFCCEICDYYTCRLSQYERHLLTGKHKKNEQSTLNQQISTKNKEYTNIENFKCICGKIYSDRSGLWRHKKICNYEDVQFKETNQESKKEESEEMNYKELILTLINQNKELQSQLIELSKEKTITNNMTNCHNKTFNLNMFLNEKCKDALNINEFIDSLKITFADLENIGENGFVNGISKIFVNGLKSLDIYKRPIHCSDLKRETMYLKEQNVWEKDNENNDRLKKAVKLIAHKNMLKINDWKEAHPQCKNSDSKKNDQYLKILISTAGPTNKEDEIAHYEKIIKNIAKEVTIDKET